MLKGRGEKCRQGVAAAAVAKHLEAWLQLVANRVQGFVSRATADVERDGQERVVRIGG